MAPQSRNILHYSLIHLQFLRASDTKLVHPWRPRGSQSGRKKRRDESFQVRAKEPQGTDAHRTVSKNSSRCCSRLLCIIVSNRRTVPTEFFSSVRTRRLLSRHTCQVRSPSLCVQGKLLFSTFLTRNEGTTDESKKRLGCYQQEQLNLPREYSVFDGSQCLVNNRKFKMRRRRESQISKISTFFPSTARLPVILFMKLDMVDRNSAPEEFACI